MESAVWKTYNQLNLKGIVMQLNKLKLYIYYSYVCTGVRSTCY